MLKGKNIDFSYSKDKTFIKNLNIDIPKGKVTTILGPNGSGKSTLLSILSCFNKPQKGDIYLDDIKLNEAVRVKSCSQLFDESDSLLHTVSLIPYPVFINKENYTGHTPKLIKSKFLMGYVYNNFIDEFNNLNNKENILLIPLGKAVEEVLLKLKDEGILSENQILIGFPHPSGANVNRLIQFEENKKKMIEFIEWKKFQ